MRKLRLDVESLEVQSFETARAEEARGTIAAHAAKTVLCSADCTEDWSCGIWCPPTGDPNPTEPCLC